jgi:transglutaminase-like putative cysteine protease
MSLRQRQEVQEMLRKPRRLISATITTFWLVMVALFIYREGWLTPSSPPPAAAEWSFAPQDQWMGIFLEGGGRVGRLHWVTGVADRDGVPGFTLKLDATLETSLFGMTTRMDIGGEAWSSADGAQSDFDFSLDSGGHTMGIKGALANKRLRATLNTGGEEVPLDFPMEENLLAGSGVGMPGSGLPELEPGQSTEIDAFDPTTMKMSKATIARLGEETISIDGKDILASVYTTTVGGMTSKAWIGSGDEVLQASTPFGFMLRKIAPEREETPVASEGGGDMIRSMAIFPTGPSTLVDATRLTVRISGVDLETIPHDPPWQVREDDLLTITQPGPLPVLPSSNPPDFDPAPFLVGDAFVTTDHPEIVAQAKEIVGDEVDVWKQALLIHAWLYENIDKVPVLSVPNALDVLRNRTGDCNEHAVLFAALARASAIPTRIAIGLVYSDTLEGFGYHAWPEVYYGGTWYPMDPTLGQVAADATHIKLLNGSIEAWVRLAAYIGQIELEVVEIE